MALGQSGLGMAQESRPWFPVIRIKKLLTSNCRYRLSFSHLIRQFTVADADFNFLELDRFGALFKPNIRPRKPNTLMCRNLPTKAMSWKDAKLTINGRQTDAKRTLIARSVAKKSPELGACKIGNNFVTQVSQPQGITQKCVHAHLLTTREREHWFL